MQQFDGVCKADRLDRVLCLAQGYGKPQDRLAGSETRMSYQIIAHVKNPSAARVLVVALQAHGFHPLEQGEGGLPGVRNLFGPEGIPVQVPEDEVRDASVLAQELLRDMAAS